MSGRLVGRGGRPHTAAVRPPSPPDRDGRRRLRSHRERLQGTSTFHPFAIVLTRGERLECDVPNAILARDGLGVHAGPGGIPTIFDNNAVDHVVGDLSEADLERAGDGGR